MSKKKITSKTTLGGIIAALSVALMFMTGLIPVMTYAIPAAAGVLLTMIVIEIDKKWAFGVYAAVALLSMFLVADKEAALMYAMFFGYYPILKAVVEKHCSVPVSWVIKLVVFNLTMVLAFLTSVYVFKIPFDAMQKYGRIAAVLLLAVGNIVFVVFDMMLTNLITLYLMKWQKLLKRLFKF
ncbi:MAG: hypothetical protein IJL63_10210 [Clostridia bacterium]|nr:hypothetical protein [Clostridia bacterium]